MQNCTIALTALYARGSRTRKGIALCWSMLLLLLCSDSAFAQMLQGKKYQDDNCNGVYDPGEQGIPNWQVRAYNATTGTTMIAWTDPSGDYQITGISPGTWIVSEEQQMGWYQTAPGSVFYTVTVLPGQIVANLDFGNRPQCASPTDTIYTGGVLDNYDSGNGLEFSSMSSNLAAVLSDLTAAPAIPQFDHMAPNYAFGHTFDNLHTAGCCIAGATLHICLSALSGGNSNDDIIGFVQGSTVVWSDSLKNLVAPPSTWMAPRQDCLTLDLGNLPASAAGITSVIAALQDGTLDVFVYDNTSVDYMELQVQYCCPPPPTGTFGGVKYHDLNANGVRDAGEPVLQGWTITAQHPATGTTLVDITDGSGAYSFVNVPIGEWIVSESQQAGWVQTAPFSVAHRGVLVTNQTISVLDFGNTTVCDDPTRVVSSSGSNEDLGTIISSAPDTDLVTYMESVYDPDPASQADGFNDFQPNKIFGHTFSGLRQPNCYIVGAHCMLQVSTNGAASADDTFGFVQGTRAVWSARISDIVGGTWSSSTATIVLDLANLPATLSGWSVSTNILAALQDGDFDLFVEDNTTVHLAQLTLDYCCLYTEIHGTKYYDIDGDGIQTYGEPELSGWVIKARNTRTGQIVSDTTDAAGNYSLSLSTTGTWQVFEVQELGWVQTEPATVRYKVPVPASPEQYGFYFGNREGCTTDSMAYTVGTRDNFDNADTSETTSPSAELQALLNAGYPAASQTHFLDDPAHDKAIGHTFSGLPVQGKIAKAVLKLYIRTTHNQSNNDRIHIVADGEGIWSENIGTLLGYTWQNSTDSVILDLTNLPGPGVTNVVGALQDGDFDFYIQDDTQLDYAVLEVWSCISCSPHGIKFHDINNNGTYEEGTDSTLAGWEIRAYNPTTQQEDTVVTNANGWYIFPTLPVGAWDIYEVQQAGWWQTAPTSVFYSIVGTVGQSIGGLDFGNTLICTSPVSTSATVGVNDNFSTANGNEYTSPGVSLQSLLDSLYASGYQSTLLDASSSEQAIGHTFTGLLSTGCSLVDARLTLHVRTTSNPLVINDRLNIVVDGKVVWSAGFDDLVGTTWKNTSATISLDLDSLPGTPVRNLIAALQDGTFSFFIQDDTQLDYATLDIQRCCPPLKSGAGESERAPRVVRGIAESRVAPNPFGDYTNISVALVEPANVRVVLCDILGNVVRTFDMGERAAGHYVVRWDGTNASGLPVTNGTYIYRIETPTFRQVGKVVLQR